MQANIKPQRKESLALSSREQNKSPLHKAIVNHKIEEALEIIDSIKLNNLKPGLDRRDKDGQTPLHLATSRGLLDVVQHLIKNGANVNRLNREGLTPAEYAVLFERKTLKDLLSGNGSNINTEKLAWVTHFSITPRRFDFIKRNADLKRDGIIIQNFLGDKELVKNIIYAYPLIMNDREFFELLLSVDNLSAKTINGIFKNIIKSNFPNGHPSRHVSALMPLFDKAQTKPKIQQALAKPIQKARFVGVSLPSPHPMVIGDDAESIWKNQDSLVIAQALAKRNQNNLKAISLSEIRSWLKNPSSAETLAILGDKFSATANWVALQILLGKNHTQQEAIAAKFAEVAIVLDELYDFEGVFQIAAGISKPEIKRLQLSPNSASYLKIMNLVSPANNFKNYRARIRKVDKDSPLVPSIAVLCADLTRSFEGINENNLQGSAEVIRVLHNMKSRPSYCFNLHKELISFFSALTFADPTIIEELSELCLPGSTWINRNNKQFEKKDPNKWIARDLVNCMHSFDEYENRKILFESGIFNGKDIKKILEIGENVIGKNSFAYIKSRVES